MGSLLYGAVHPWREQAREGPARLLLLFCIHALPLSPRRAQVREGAAFRLCVIGAVCLAARCGHLPPISKLQLWRCLPQSDIFHSQVAAMALSLGTLFH